MRAALLTTAEPRLDVVADVDVREPGANEVLVRVHHCGICHSDLGVIDSGTGGPLPLVLGHEASGVVEAVGPGVTRLVAGDAVLLTPLGPCGRCYWCARSQPTLCVDARAFTTGRLPDGTTPLARGGAEVYQGLGVGGFAEYALVQERNVVKIDPDVPLDVACVLGCAVQTGVGAVLNTASVEPGATVLVMGAGGIGMSVILGAKVAGASRIIVSDPVALRRDAAADLGATDIIDPTADDVTERVKELTGGIGADYAFDAAGSTALVETGLAATRIGGTTVMVGAPSITESVTIPLAVLFVTWEKKLLGSLLGSCDSHRDVPRYLSMWRRGALDLEALISAHVPLDAINDGLDRVRTSTGIRTVVDLI